MMTGWRPVSFGAARVVTRLAVPEDIVWLEPWTKLGMASGSTEQQIRSPSQESQD
jgi:hypothetical protein